MKRSLLFVLSALGLLGAAYSAWLFGRPHPVEPPVFQPAANPYGKGIYAIGMVEADQSSGANTNLYFEVGGTVSHVLVHEGDRVKQGAPLVALDDSIPRALAEQQGAAAVAAGHLLEELRAQPRPETLSVAQAQSEVARANRQLAQTQYDKLAEAQGIDAGSVSRDAVDNARNSLQVAKANAELADRQLALTKAGAWSYDIANQQAQAKALDGAAAAAKAQLGKYLLRAPRDAVVLAISITEGSYVSAQGSFDIYSNGYLPPVVLGAGSGQTLAVRCYVDEILLQRLPQAAQVKAEMAVRGSTTRIPLSFVRIQPFVSPKVELANQRQERVDVRVLPVIFRFTPPAGTRIFPGQQVDVYIADQS